MKINRASRRYARALFETALDNQSTSDVHEDALALLEIIESSIDFREYLSNPLIQPAQQKDILDSLFKGKISSDMKKFLHFLCDNEKLPLLDQICRQFEALHLDYNKTVKAHLISSAALTKDQVKAICDKLKKHFKKDVVPSMVVDKSLLGGFKVEVGDVVYDYSVRRQLVKYREAVVTA